MQGNGVYHICDDFAIDDWLREKILASEDELMWERDCVAHLLPNHGPASCQITESTQDSSLPGEN